MTHQLATGRTATLIKLAFAAGAKTAAAFAAFALTALVTRNMPSDEAGLFLLGFTLLAVLSILFRLGLDNVILRFLSAHGTDDFAQEKLNRGLLWIATATIPATIVGMALSDQIATHIFNKPAFAEVLFWMLPALPAMALFFLLSFAFQAQHRVVLTTLFQNLGISTLFIAGCGYLWFNQPEAINAVTSAQIYGIAAASVFIAAIVLWFSQRNTRFKLVGYRDPELTRASMNLWTASIMSLAVQWSGILIAGVMLSAEEVAQLTAAQRTAMLASFALMVVEIVVAPSYARFWKDGDKDGFYKYVAFSTKVLVVAGLPIGLLAYIYSDLVMTIFGADYARSHTLLKILLVGQIINICTGPVSHVINMTGNERGYRNITSFTGLVTIFMCFVLIGAWGAEGAALAVALGVSAQNISSLFYVRVVLGFWMWEGRNAN